MPRRTVSELNTLSSEDTLISRLQIPQILSYLCDMAIHFGKLSRLAPKALKKARRRQTLATPTITTSKAEEFFNITELAEEILSFLPFRDLLLVQRVCRSFRATVQGSIQLQRLLFLEPEGGFNNCSLKINPFVSITILNIVRDNDIHRRIPGDKSKIAAFIPPGYLNIFVRSESRIHGLKAPKRKSFQHNLREFFFEQDPQASWRRMYITQPPVPTFQVSLKSWFAPAGHDLVWRLEDLR